MASTTALDALQRLYSYYGLQQHSTAAEPAGPVHDASRYPHRCPYCGAHCYVGLRHIEHEQPRECP